MKKIFAPANILLPNRDISPEAWSVIACDQFSSEPSYWERVKKLVGTKPSTLNMIIPEAYLDDINEEAKIDKISKTMEDYISRGLFRELKDSFVYVERTLSDGQSVRKGLIGVVDLEEYDFTGKSNAAILASEGTALDRLPPRIRVREAASLELPHIMTLIADKNNTVIEPVAGITDSLPLLYDFELMEGGGVIKGFQVSGEPAQDVSKALQSLYEVNRAHEPPLCLMIMGDGNHSLAAAKTYWDGIKRDLSENRQKTHPARFALLEVNNLYDPAVHFEAIHRVIFDVDTERFLSAFIDAIPVGKDYMLEVLTSGNGQKLPLSAGSTGDVYAKVQDFIDDYINRFGGRVDYIHGDEAVKKLTGEKNSAGILLPIVTKPEFFDTVASKGIFPRKSFSIGHAGDKRYYMECRKIV